MKKSILMALALCTVSASIAHAGDKICKQTTDGDITNTPCTMGKKTSQAVFMNMIFHNTDGYQSLVSPSNKQRLEMLGFPEDTVHVTALSYKNDEHARPKGVTTVIQYEVAMDDCGTTDTCGSKFMWTVTETMFADGYSVGLNYKNTILPVTVFPSWVKNQ